MWMFVLTKVIAVRSHKDTEEVESSLFLRNCYSSGNGERITYSPYINLHRKGSGFPCPHLHHVADDAIILPLQLFCSKVSCSEGEKKGTVAYELSCHRSLWLSQWQSASVGFLALCYNYWFASCITNITNGRPLVCIPTVCKILCMAAHSSRLRLFSLQIKGEFEYLSS